MKWGGPIATPGAHERIQNFIQQTTLPPAGVLQSSGSVGPRLLVDFLDPSDTLVDVGGRPTTQPREAAVDATGADRAASDAAAVTQRICRRPQLLQQSLRQAGTPAATLKCYRIAHLWPDPVFCVAIETPSPFPFQLTILPLPPPPLDLLAPSPLARITTDSDAIG